MNNLSLADMVGIPAHATSMLQFLGSQQQPVPTSAARQRNSTWTAHLTGRPTAPSKPRASPPSTPLPLL